MQVPYPAFTFHPRLLLRIYIEHMPLCICMELSGFLGVGNERDLMLQRGIKVPKGSILQEQQHIRKEPSN